MPIHSGKPSVCHHPPEHSRCSALAGHGSACCSVKDAAAPERSCRLLYVGLWDSLRIRGLGFKELAPGCGGSETCRSSSRLKSRCAVMPIVNSDSVAQAQRQAWSSLEVQIEHAGVGCGMHLSLLSYEKQAGPGCCTLLYPRVLQPGQSGVPRPRYYASSRFLPRNNLSGT